MKAIIYVIQFIVFETDFCPSNIEGCLVDHRKSVENIQGFINRDNAMHFLKGAGYNAKIDSLTNDAELINFITKHNGLNIQP